jgi:predicted nucleic acid-binding protein
LGTLEQDLSAHTIIGVDTAAFIYLWEQHPRYELLAKTLFLYLKKPQIYGVTSIITLIEATVQPQRQGRLDLVRSYERALLHSQQVRMLPVDTALARRAVTVRSQYDIRIPDALQVAAALEAGATAFVTNDHRLARIRELRFFLFDDYAEP